MPTTINSPHYGKVSVTTIDLNGRVENTYSFNKSTFSMTQELSFKQMVCI
ncbi:MAG: hypothetical protein U0X76_05010 [Bacteroidia bacterium]